MMKISVKLVAPRERGSPSGPRLGQDSKSEMVLFRLQFHQRLYFSSFHGRTRDCSTRWIGASLARVLQFLFRHPWSLLLSSPWSFGLAFFGLTFAPCSGRLIKINEVHRLFILLTEVSAITWISPAATSALSSCRQLLDPGGCKYLQFLAAFQVG